MIKGVKFIYDTKDVVVFFDGFYKEELETADLNDYKNLRLYPSYDYLDEIKKRVLKNKVTFSQFHYNIGKVTINSYLVKKVYYNSMGILIFEGKNPNELAAVDERKPVIYRLTKQIFNELDPYGEEDWEE